MNFNQTKNWIDKVKIYTSNFIYVVFVLIAVIQFQFLFANVAHGSLMVSPVGGGELSSGLVGWWTFDGVDMIQNVRDRSGNSNNGFMSGFGATSSAVVAGKIGQGLKFDGVDDKITLPTINLTSTGGSISFWAKRGTGVLQGVIKNSSYAYSILFSNTTLQAYWLNSASSAHYISLTGTSKDVWAFYTVTFDVSGNNVNVKGYVNAGSPSTASYTDGFGSFNVSEIGNNAGYYFNGAVDDVRIYNRSLSAGEISKIYNLGASAKINSSEVAPTDLKTGLVGWWTFDGKDTPWTSATAATTLDKSGNGNTGTLTNMNRAIAPVAGKVGQGLSFDGTDDYVRTGNLSALDGATQATWSFWHRQNELKWSSNFISKWDGNYDQISWLITTCPSSFGGGGYLDEFCVFFSGGVFAHTGLNGNANVAGSWQYLTVVYDGSKPTNDTKLKIYVNGIPKTLSFNGTIPTSLNVVGRNVLIGAESYTSVGARNYVNASLDDVRIYNRVLSTNEIKQLYNVGASNHNVSAPGGDTLSQGLVGWWTFDGKDTPWTSATTATTLDKSGNGNTGTLTNMDRAIAPVAGKIGQGLSFDGDDRIESSDSASLKPTQVTLSAWIKPMATTGALGAGIITKVNSGANSGYALRFISGSPGTIRMHVNAYNANYADISGVVLGNWYHVVGTFDGTNVRVYLNGVAGSATTDSAISYTTDDVEIGRAFQNNVYSFNGSLDDVRMYNRALSLEEIKKLYNSGR